MYIFLTQISLPVTSVKGIARINLSIATLELFPVPVHSPWHHVGIDFVGPISPKTTLGNSYILTLCDYFTKWVEAVACPTKEASGIASSLAL